MNASTLFVQPGFTSGQHLSLGSPSITVGLATSITLVIALYFLGVSKPTIDQRSPKFVSATLPFLGAFSYITGHWTFWQNATKESKTGNFSFWLGRKHIVGVTGAAAREMFFEHPSLDLNDAQVLLPFGVHFWPPIHEIFIPRDVKFQKTTYWLKTLAGFIKTPNIQRCLPSTVGDAYTDFRALKLDHPSGVVNSPDLWRTVFKQNCRMFLADDIADDATLFKTATNHLDVILHTFSPFYALYRWIPEPSMIRRRFARHGLQRIIRKLLKERSQAQKMSKNDPLQALIKNGDPEEYITEFMVSAAFITTVNAHVIAAQMINTMAIHVGWQEKVYNELQGVANKYCSDKNALLVEKLREIPLAGWEDSFPIMDLCLDEVIRVWTSFPVGRYNVSPDPIPIPGSTEVIPGYTYAVYNTTELHFNDKLYPRPTKFDPERFVAGREEFKQETHGWFGWGAGTRLCTGMRWAKLQQHIIVSHALALYEWSSCDAEGRPDPYAAQRQGLDADLDAEMPFALPPSFVRFADRT